MRERMTEQVSFESIPENSMLFILSKCNLLSDSTDLWAWAACCEQCLFVVLGEGDLIYTKTLCRIGHEDYTNKSVLVLGGGDGGILNELRKETVGFVTLVEIGILQSSCILKRLFISLMFW